MFTDPKALHEYALAGHATLTLTSEKTGAWYTYRVSQAKDRATGEPQPRWFVALLTGPENTSDYSYMGMLDEAGFRLTKASKFAPDTKSVQAFAYAWKHVSAGQMPPQVAIRHEGRCGRCGRTLTVPESIDSGLGPECRSKMGG
jgi:hypothetical protein